MKKVISLLLAFCLSVLLASPAFATQSQEDELLLEIGFSREEINALNEKEKEYICSFAQENDVGYAGMSTITLSETNEDGNQTYGLIDSTVMNLNIINLTVRGGTDAEGKIIVKRVNVIISYEWFNSHPAVKKEDAISVNWDNRVFSYYSFENTDYYCMYKDEDGDPVWTSRGSVNTPYTLSQGGLGYYTTLRNPFIGGVDLQGLNGIASVMLEPAFPMYEGTGYSSAVNVVYVHDKNPLEVVDLSFEVDGVTISIQEGLLSDSVAASTLIRYTK